jgi:hypothetical protein
MDKFNMGDMPRSRTGLVPCTFRRKQDSFSTWSKLPPQPARELYPYRGDFINARNRKKKEERKAKIDAMKRSVVTSNNIECSSTVAVPPCSPRDSPTKGNVGWNANYKHNSFQLTPDEQQQRAENKNKFTDFLRIEACKRHARASSNDKKKVAVVLFDKKATLSLMWHFSGDRIQTKASHDGTNQTLHGCFVLVTPSINFINCMK